MIKFIEIAKSCADGIFTSSPFSEAKQNSIALLLLETAATESHFLARRQTGFTWNDARGAWGIWQTEKTPVYDSLAYLKRKPKLALRCAEWLYGVPNANLDFLFEVASDSPQSFMQLIASWDALACLFARLHYYRRPESVPDTIKKRAAYYKKFYNSIKGKGSVEKYLTDVNAHLNPFFERMKKKSQEFTVVKN